MARTCLVDGTQHAAQVASRKCCLIVGGEAGVGLKCWHSPEMTWGTLRAKLEEGGIEPYPHHIFADEEPGYYEEKWPGGIEHLPPPKEAAASTGDTVSPEELAAFLAEPSVPSWERLACLMQQVRLGLQPGENGRVRPKRRLQVEKEVWEFALRAIERRGKLFVDAYPFIFLSDETKIVKFHNSGEANALLSRLGLLVTQSHTNLVRENLSQHILLHGTPTHIEKLGCMRGEAVYVNDGSGGMFKVTANEITEEENGTADVYRVLVVEDDEVIRTLLHEELQRDGFEAVIASNVPEALRFIATETFDVLLSDLHMPLAGDGFTVVSAMRHTHPTLRSLFLSCANRSKICFSITDENR